MANVCAAVAKIQKPTCHLFEVLLGLDLLHLSQYDMCVAVQSINFVFGFGILNIYALCLCQNR